MSGTERAQRALGFLRSRIVSGEWPVNSRIPTEPELMELIGVGKTTVREAVRSLASHGMLEPLAGRGTFVRSRTPVSSVITDFLTAYELEEVLALRRALEIEGARRAAMERSDAQLQKLRDASNAAVHGGAGRTPGHLHALIMEASGTRLLPDLYASVMSKIREAVNRGEIDNMETDSARQDDHHSIVSAIAAAKPLDAAEAMASHVERDLAIVAVPPARVTG